MAETIEVEVGDLYADMHDQFETELGDEYTQQIRQVLENNLHQLNQQLERARDEQISEFDIDDEL